jgi:hypothetical protein
MTRLLKQAFEAASKLPEDEQNALAALILEEVEAEGQWEASFASSEPQLERLAAEALEDHRKGRTRPLDPDKM